MIKYEVARLIRAGAFDMPEYIERGLFTDREYCLKYLFNLYRQHFPDQEIVPMAGLLDSERRIYKRLFETSSLAKDDAEEISDRLVGRRFDELIALEDAIRVELRKHSSFSRLRDGEIIVDVPSKERERASGERGGKVFVYNQRPAIGRGDQLSGATPVLEHLREQHRRLNRICRVFIAPHRVGDAKAMSDAARIVEGVIRSSVGI